MTYIITKKSVLKKKMKEQLPEGSRLSSKAVDEMDRILHSIFQRVMDEVKVQPYQDFSDYTIYKHGNKYLTNNASALRKLKNVKEELEVFLGAEIENKKDEGNE